MEKIRLQKYASECGLMSRRAAESEIVAGNFTVNGTVASLGDKVDPDSDVILYKGREIKNEKRGEDGLCRNTYILLNKPIGYVTTMADEEGRLSIAELTKSVGVRVYPVGRLDMYSDGALICTNDGEIANKLLHPSHHVAKKYTATVMAHLTEDDIKKLAEPFELDGYMLKPFDVRFIEYTDGMTVVEFTLYEGRNREIRNIVAHHGYKLKRLTRTSVGEISLGDLPIGKWRSLDENEINYLRNI